MMAQQLTRAECEEIRITLVVVQGHGTRALKYGQNAAHYNQQLGYERAFALGFLLLTPDPDDGTQIELSNRCTLCSKQHINLHCRVSLSAAGLAFLEAEQNRLKEMNQKLLEDCRGLAHQETKSDFKESEHSGVVG